jgi:hypothetical protein
LLLLLQLRLLLARAAKGSAQACECSWELLELGKGAAGLLLLDRLLLLCCKLLLLLVNCGDLLLLLRPRLQVCTGWHSLYGVACIKHHGFGGTPQLASSSSSTCTTIWC